MFHGDYRKLFEAPGVYESITAEDVRKAAATVLRTENRTVGIVEPKPAAETTGSGSAAAAGGAR